MQAKAFFSLLSFRAVFVVAFENQFHLVSPLINKWVTVSMSDTTTLDLIAPGETVTVAAVEGDDEVSRRLTDLGFWPGTTIEIVRRSPLGDPTQYALRGFHLALRANEAQRVSVTRVSRGSGS